MDLLGESPMPVDSTALALASVLSGLDEEEREYIYELINVACSHLQKRKVPVEKRKEPRPKPN